MVSSYSKVGTGMQLLPVIPSLPCTTQTNENELIMPAAGQTAIDFRVMYSEMAYVRMKEMVTILTAPAGVNVGTKYLVTQVNDYSTPGLEHLEVKLQGGVT